MSSSDLLRQAVDTARAGRRVEARTMLMELVEHDPHNEMAWMWLSGLMDDLGDRIIACENVLTINPANDKVRAYLADLHRQRPRIAVVINQQEAERIDFDQRPGNIVVVMSKTTKEDEKKDDPLRVAELLELDGKYEEALEIYKVQAGTAKDLKVFDHIYQQIVRLERLQGEKIRHISPGLSIARLTLTWPLLYLSLSLMQVGLNPFAHPTAYLWLGFPLVVLGGFFLALSEIKSRNVILKKLFIDDAKETSFMQVTAALAGWLLIIMPMSFIVLDSIRRLANFQIPPRLFP
jgi:tetratricopeptide (TPR) repeat protein